MKKKLLILPAILLVQTAFANTPNSGLACTMSYSASGPLNAAKKESTTSWLVAGATMKGTAVSSDGDAAGTSPANYITVKKTKLWTVSILNAEKSVLGSFSFNLESGMKATIPVEAHADESEDPNQYDTLEVTCHVVCNKTISEI